MIKVIGAGFGRTGTLSLKAALEQLGFTKCYHMMEVRHHPSHVPLWRDAHQGKAIDWDSLFSGYQASVDWPSCNLWREQLQHFPDARVILSLRDPESWYESVMNTIYPITRDNLASSDPTRQQMGEWAMELIWDRLFDGRLDDRAHTISVFNQHNDSVRQALGPEKLLVFEAKDGWQPLCDFLQLDVPDEPYPRSNSTSEFQQMVKASNDAPRNSNSSETE